MNSTLTSKQIVFSLFLLVLIYISPVIFSIDFNDALKPYARDEEGFRSSLYRSALLSITTSFIIILISFLISLLLFSIQFFSKSGKNLSFLLLPVLLGNISSSYIFKQALSNSSVMNYLLSDHRYSLFSSWTLLQFWQFGSLFIYLFWLNFQNIPVGTLNYAKVSNLKFGSIIKDIVVPASRNLIILLLMLAFLFSFYEDAKASMVFHFSRGTETELINGWLQRTYHQNSRISLTILTPKYYNYSLFIMISGALLLFTLISAQNKFLKSFSRGNKVSRSIAALLNKKPGPLIGKIVFACLMLIILYPILLPFIRIKPHVPAEMSELLTAALWTFVAALVSTLLALVFGIFSRLGWPETLVDFNNKSLFFYILIFLLLLIAPLCLYLVTFYWLHQTSYSNLLLSFTWVIIHSISSLPLLGGFILTVHFGLNKRELTYLDSFKISTKEILRWHFIKRFKLQYLLTFIFSYSLIWNDHGINTIFSDNMPCFAAALKMSFSGRAADQYLGISYFSVSIFVAVLCILIWIKLLNKAEKLYRSYE